MPTRSTSVSLRNPGGLTWAWLVDFLRRELAPYPGRASTVARMTIAATIVMLAIMTFHIPNGALGGYYALVITRENLRSTFQQAFMNTLAFVAGTVYTLIGMLLFVDSPVSHFFWVVGSLYLIFFVMGTVRNYGMAAGFSFLIATAIPLWDRAGPVEPKIHGTLWILLGVALGSGSALLVEVVYHSFHPRDSVVSGLVERLHCVEATLRTYARGDRLSPPHQAKLLQYAMIGPASLRRAVVRAGQASQQRAQIAAFISLTGRLVDLTVSLEQYLPGPSPLKGSAARDGQQRTAHAATQLPRKPGAGLLPQEAARLNAVADALHAEAEATNKLAAIEDVLGLVTPAWRGPETPAPGLPLLPVLEQTVTMLRGIFSPPVGETSEHSRQRELLAMQDKPAASSLFVPDAFTNTDHLVFALRGCFAASLCYLIYNVADWPGINTAVATCIITALGTIGSSRQKQVLRIGGAVAGGFLISLPAQVYLLPLMDSITSFTLYFAAITALAAWFATSSPRLSYFGLQIALAFYLINLQEFTVQVSLAVARDRVVGVLLGLVAMWVVFDQLWAPLAADRMQTLLATNLQSLARLALTVTTMDTAEERQARDAVLRFRSLREKINGDFSQMNEQADALEFEVGKERRQKLRSRDLMQAMQPAMRTIFLLEIGLGQYRVMLREARRERQQAFAAFQRACAHLLEALADRVRHSRRTSPPAALLHAVRTSLAHLEHQARDDQAALTLCREIAEAFEVLWQAQYEMAPAPKKAARPNVEPLPSATAP